MNVRRYLIFSCMFFSTVYSMDHQQSQSTFSHEVDAFIKILEENMGITAERSQDAGPAVGNLNNISEKTN